MVHYRCDFRLSWKPGLQEPQIKKIKDVLSKIFSNRSSVYFSAGAYLKSFYSAKQSWWLSDKTFNKAKLKIAYAAMKLGWFYKARKILAQQNEPIDEAEFNKNIANAASDENSIKVLTSLDPNGFSSYLGPMEVFKGPGGRSYRAVEDIEVGTTLLIDKKYFPCETLAELCYELLNYLDQNEDMRALYMRLYPCKKYPVQKQSDSISLVAKVTKEQFEAKRGDKTWKNFSQEEINEFIMKLIYNGFKDFHSKEVMYTQLSLFNHSCAPNAVLLEGEHGIIVKAVRPIPKGSEVLISYVSQHDNYAERQTVCEYYGFKCECARCVTKDRQKDEKRVKKISEVFDNIPDFGNDYSKLKEWFAGVVKLAKHVITNGFYIKILYLLPKYKDYFYEEVDESMVKRTERFEEFKQMFSVIGITPGITEYFISSIN